MPRRPGDGLFKCHGVETKTEAIAIDLTKQLSKITNEVRATAPHPAPPDAPQCRGRLEASLGF